jgi:hypothetical protein
MPCIALRAELELEIRLAGYKQRIGAHSPMIGTDHQMMPFADPRNLAKIAAFSQRNIDREDQYPFGSTLSQFAVTLGQSSIQVLRLGANKARAERSSELQTVGGVADDESALKTGKSRCDGNHTAKEEFIQTKPFGVAQHVLKALLAAPKAFHRQ